MLADRTRKCVIKSDTRHCRADARTAAVAVIPAARCACGVWPALIWAGRMAECA